MWILNGKKIVFFLFLFDIPVEKNKKTVLYEKQII